MLIVACIKQVPDTTQVKIDPVTNSLVREGIPFIVNPFDIHALEEALRIKDKFGARVVAISMGPPNSEMTLRKALSLGVDESIMLSDRVFSGADTLVTSLVLSKAIMMLAEKDELALVLCGRQSIDGDTGQVGPGIAIRLGLAQLTLVDRINDIDFRNRKIRVSRKLEGRHEIVEARLPAMISVVREINKPRYPSVPMRLEAHEERSLTLWGNKIMKFDARQIGLKGSPTTVRKIFSPEHAKGEILGDGVSDPEGTARMLVEKLAQKELLPLE